MSRLQSVACGHAEIHVLKDTRQKFGLFCYTERSNEQNTDTDVAAARRRSARYESYVHSLPLTAQPRTPVRSYAHI